MEKAIAPHSSTLAWKIPWTQEPGRLQSMGVAKSRTRLSDFTFPFHFHALEKEMAPHSSVLAWRIPGMGEPGGLPSLGSHRVGHDWSDLAAAAAATYYIFLHVFTICALIFKEGFLQKVYSWVVILTTLTVSGFCLLYLHHLHLNQLII